jgi:hypothetical protein
MVRKLKAHGDRRRLDDLGLTLLVKAAVVVAEARDHEGHVGHARVDGLGDRFLEVVVPQV